MSDMQTTVRRNVVRHAVSRQMFCQFPKCGRCLDAPTAAFITASDGGSAVFCGSCWDGFKPTALESIQAGDLEVWTGDGKEVTE